MTHHHDHGHHHHQHDSQSTLSFDEKMIKLLEHWIKHNDDHARTYRDWAQKAKDNDMPDTAAFLETAAAMTDKISKNFQEAVGTLASSK